VAHNARIEPLELKLLLFRSSSPAGGTKRCMPPVVAKPSSFLRHSFRLQFSSFAMACTPPGWSARTHLPMAARSLLFCSVFSCSRAWDDATGEALS
jgi:hypothetical protein